MGCFVRVGKKARGGWVAGEVAGKQLDLGRWLEEVVDAVDDCLCLSHGVAKPLNVRLEVEVVVVAFDGFDDRRGVDRDHWWIQ